MVFFFESFSPRGAERQDQERVTGPNRRRVNPTAHQRRLRSNLRQKKCCWPRTRRCLKKRNKRKNRWLPTSFSKKRPRKTKTIPLAKRCIQPMWRKILESSRHGDAAGCSAGKIGTQSSQNRADFTPAKGLFNEKNKYDDAEQYPGQTCMCLKKEQELRAFVVGLDSDCIRPLGPLKTPLISRC